MNWHIFPSRLTNIIFQISYMKETVHINVKTGLPLCIADCLSDGLLYSSSHFTHLPAEKERV